MKGKIMKMSRKKLMISTVLLGSLSLIAAQQSSKIDNFVKQFSKLKESLNYDLYKNEAAKCEESSNTNKKDCRDAENEEFKGIGKEILTAQEKLASAQARLNNAEIKINHWYNIGENLSGYVKMDHVNETNVGKLAQLYNDVKNGFKSNLSNDPAEIKSHRVFHAKQHGCLTAKLKLTSNDERTKQLQDLKLNVNDLEVLNRGIFKVGEEQNKEYQAIVRLSSGLGIAYPDIVPDVKGFAIKLLDVADGPEKKSVDLLMTSGPNPFGNNLRDFADFMNATTTGIKISPLVSPIDAVIFINKQKILQRFTHIQKVPERTSINSKISFSKLQFWSGHPYLLKSDDSPEETAMKFNISPQNKGGDKLLSETGGKASPALYLHPNHLREDLKGRFANGETIKYDFNLQLERDSTKTPIESTVVEWKEADSPSIKVGELIIEPQNFDNKEIDAVCEEANFTPAHFHSQHRPLSNMGRGRIVAYRASQFGRALRGELPKDLTIENYNTIKQLNKK